MVQLIQGEAKTLEFTITDCGGTVVNVESATFTFGAKTRPEKEALSFVHSHNDFDLTDASSGVVTVTLTTSDTSIDEGNYAAQLKTKFSADNIDIANVDLEIVKGIL